MTEDEIKRILSLITPSSEVTPSDLIDALQSAGLILENPQKPEKPLRPQTVEENYIENKTDVLSENAHIFKSKAKLGLFNKKESETLISNFKSFIEDRSAHYSETGSKEAGIAYDQTHRLFSQINSLVADYGEEITATALERARQKTNFEEKWLYYIAKEGTMAYNEQESFVDEFIGEIISFSTFINLEIEDLKNYKKTAEYKEEKEDYKVKTEAYKEEKKEYDKKKAAYLRKKELSKEYHKKLRNIKALLVRREKAGVEFKKNEIPPTPKVITAGSIRKLSRIQTRIKVEYRYLGKGKYKGANHGKSNRKA